MSDKYFPPKKRVKSFHCPFCGVYARQYWGPAIHYPERHTNLEIPRLLVALCEKCENQSFWMGEIMVYPATSSAPLPADDMPNEVKQDFNEAREVLSQSPRSAAALLRLALQKFMSELGESGKNINARAHYILRKAVKGISLAPYVLYNWLRASSLPRGFLRAPSALRLLGSFAHMRCKRAHA